MAVEPTQLAPGGGLAQGTPGQPKQAPDLGSDPSNEPGQYPASLFGVALPAGTGADGSAGAYGMATDPSNEPGQTSEGFSGLGPDDIADTGAPGSSGATEPNGGSAVSFTEPGSFLSGTNQTSSVTASVSGTNDWTQAMNGYGTGGQMPGVAGNTPQLTGAGSGRVMRGGRAVS